ncbi:M3 family oligoendopeptidase [Clostridium sp. 'deep sea']|uniref:M3 family oligoendopeptidase n=1 Tax=Clostridium sp. 'deep sea' TaxID=2779445 RepID=UPI0018968DFD|nr:M3 family oligoendopeptidase [Clostridium sp. 'deep sea']QOR35562.1 M3 family oligoendopeptidase [Clostridium sp. 'deep sea']
MLNNIKSTWDLDVYFPGGSESVEFSNYLNEMQNDMKEFCEELQTLKTNDGNIENIKYVVNFIQEISRKMHHAGSFASCLTAQNTQDKKAMQLVGRLNGLRGIISSLTTEMEKRLLELSDDAFNNLFTDDYFTNIKFNLTEIRENASKKLPADKENIINSLAIDGYNSWNTLYNLTSGNLKIPVEIDGVIKQLSPGQASNLMTSADRELREKVFKSWEESWQSIADTCALALNSISGFRLNVYKERGWHDFLSEPLTINRMTRKTLDTMWSTIQKNTGRLVKFLERKKELLGLEKLTWHDYTAPLGKSNKTYSLEEGANFVAKHMKNFNKSMGDLVERAFNENWVETENRDNKRAGAFCSGSPILKQSRVFMTYSGAARNLTTLAHELGHAYHSSVMTDLPPLSQRYAMNVAETASTFNEFVVSNASLQEAETKEEKIALLHADLARAVSLCMNIQARFLFETRFYERRKTGFVSTKELNELMLQAQKDAFNNSLDSYHPLFWASKLHFYITGVPFYNFPYAFGYLFSAGVYAQSKTQGEAFEQNYINLLRDTARMKVEDLAKKHLAVDLEDEKFWQEALDVVLAGYDEFMELTK